MALVMHVYKSCNKTSFIHVTIGSPESFPSRLEKAATVVVRSEAAMSPVLITIRDATPLGCIVASPQDGQCDVLASIELELPCLRH